MIPVGGKGSMTEVEEKHLTEIVKDLALNAIRGSQVTLNLEDFEQRVFPVFKRRGSSVMRSNSIKVILTYFPSIQ